MAITITSQREEGYWQPVRVINWSFTTDASGDASEQTTYAFYGLVQRVVTIPDGVDTPTAAWDLTIEDEDTVDTLDGNGLNRDSGGTGAIEQCVPANKVAAVASKLTFKVANGGNTKKGVVKAYII